MSQNGYGRALCLSLSFCRGRGGSGLRDPCPRLLLYTRGPMVHRCGVQGFAGLGNVAAEGLKRGIDDLTARWLGSGSELRKGLRTELPTSTHRWPTTSSSSFHDLKNRKHRLLQILIAMQDRQRQGASNGRQSLEPARLPSQFLRRLTTGKPAKWNSSLQCTSTVAK